MNFAKSLIVVSIEATVWSGSPLALRAPYACTQATRPATRRSGATRSPRGRRVVANGRHRSAVLPARRATNGRIRCTRHPALRISSTSASTVH